MDWSSGNFLNGLHVIDGMWACDLGPETAYVEFVLILVPGTWVSRNRVEFTLGPSLR